jgi:hypothetical protein
MRKKAGGALYNLTGASLLEGILRKALLDAPGTRITLPVKASSAKIIQENTDRNDFLKRLEEDTTSRFFQEVV